MINKITITGKEYKQRYGRRYCVYFEVNHEAVTAAVDLSRLRLLTLLGIAYKYNINQGWVHKKNMFMVEDYVARYLHRLKQQIKEALDWSVFMNDRSGSYRLAHHGQLEIDNSVFGLGDYNINRFKERTNWETKAGVTPDITIIPIN